MYPGDYMQLYMNTHTEILVLQFDPFLIFLINTSINVNKNYYGSVKLLVKRVDCTIIFFQAVTLSITTFLL